MASAAPDSLHGTLHQLHLTASRSDSLTTFDDLTAPPAPAAAGEPKGIELVHGGLSGLYSRIRASVGGARDVGTDGTDSLSSGSRRRNSSRPSVLARSPAGTLASSPVTVSAPSPRLQSPSSAAFPDVPPPPSRDSTVSNATFTSKLSLNGSKTSLQTTRSRPPIATSNEPAWALRDDDSFAHSPVSTHSRVQSGSAFDLPKNGSVKDFAPAAGSSRSPRFAPVRDSGLRRKRSNMEYEAQESDDTEDDMAVVDGDKPVDTAGYKFPSDAVRDSPSNFRSEGPFQSPRLQAVNPKDQCDNGSEETEKPHVTASARTPVIAPEPPRPPLVKVGPLHLPGFQTSRTSSSDGISSVITTSTMRTPTVPPIKEIQRQAQASPAVNSMPRSAFTQMRRKILDKEFWMRDENAKDCFNCGDAFTTFRRKHHCRTCGQIFDSKCTSIVSGKLFGQPGNLRVCKPCENIIYGHDDDSSDYSDDGDQASIYDNSNQVEDFDDD